MKKNKFVTWFSYGFLFFILILSVFPIYFAFTIATKLPVDAFSTEFKFFYTPSFDNFRLLWVERGFTKYLLNTLIVTLSCVLISVPIATLCAYGLIRHNSKFSNSILDSTLVLRMFPPMLLVIPYFLLATRLRLTDSYITLIAIVIAVNQPFAIWLMRGFLLGIPKELDDASKIDGCNMIQTVTKVYLPLAMPGITTASIFTFLLSYNEYLFALVLTGKKTLTLPVAIGQYGAEDLSYWTINAAGVVSIILPICLAMIFLQRWLVKGVTAGAVKG